jgi:hypothetical protein
VDEFERVFGGGEIARCGRHILQEYTVDQFDFLQAAQFMTPEPEVLPGSMTLADVF